MRHSYTYTLTEEGRRKVQTYLRELSEKRKEILNAGIDTASETQLPTEEDILSDMEWVVPESNGKEYLNNWGVTDNYDGDAPLGLEAGIDFN